MTETLALVLAFGALILAWRASRQVKALAARLATLEPAREIRDTPQVLDTPQALDTPQDSAPEAATPTRVWTPRAGSGALVALGKWLRANWIYPIAGAALVMAAVYLVQYSIERGLLSPQARIGLALALGAALIGAAEFLRRRFAAAESGAALVAATLAGAGIVTLLAAVLAAFHLYAMIGQGSTLVALAAVSILAVGLGWVHGPMLAALGILAGAAAPFLLGEGNAPKDLLYGYFALVSALGLAISGLRRWGWIAALAVIAPLWGGILIRAAGAGEIGFAALALIVSALALALPDGALFPRGQGAMLSQLRQQRPAAATIAAALASLLAAIGLVVLNDGLSAPIALLALAMLVGAGTRNAPALADQVLIPLVGVIAWIARTASLAPWQTGVLMQSQPMVAPLLVGLATLTALVLLNRSEATSGKMRDFWALTGLAVPGATMITLELMWHPAAQGLGVTSWALIAMALAAFYTGVALWAARRDHGQGLRVGGATAAAFAMIALALMLVLSLAALTVALAVLLVAAAAMDRRFDIPLLGWFNVLSAMALAWRMTIDPGMFWLIDDGAGGAGLLDVALTLVSVLLAPWLALRLAPTPHRDWSRVIVETASVAMIPLAELVIVARLLPEETLSLTAILGVVATTLMVMAKVQLTRAQLLAGQRALLWFRWALASVMGLGAALMAGLAVSVFSPLFAGGFFDVVVRGWPVVNDLLLAYAAPGAALIWVTRGLKGPAIRLCRGVAGVLLAYWVGCVIRHLWHADQGMALSRGFVQGELYAYTVALLVAGAAAIALALRLRRTALRRLGLALIALAAAKAFLVDAAGLSGMLRVGAFLGLGLSLAGLAWLNTWVAGRSRAQDMQ